MPKLLTFSKAAADLGVPEKSLRTAADQNGLTIRFGRALRLHPDDLVELIKLCRVKPKAPVSTGEKSPDVPLIGKSGIPTPGYRPAQAAAQKLKRRSPRTSAENTAQVVPLSRET